MKPSRPLNLEMEELRGESKFEKCTLSVEVTFRGWGNNSIDALSGIHFSLISKNIIILTGILTIRGQGGLMITLV